MWADVIICPCLKIEERDTHSRDFSHELVATYIKLIDCKPQHYIPNIIKALKGIGVRLLMLKYKDELKKEIMGRAFVESVIFHINS